MELCSAARISKLENLLQLKSLKETEVWCFWNRFIFSAFSFYTLILFSCVDNEVDKKTTLREVKILKILNHVNIVNLIEAFKRKGKLYLVFECCDKNMLELLEEHPDGLEPEQVRFFIWQLCRGLEYCHRNGIIHRGLLILLLFYIIKCIYVSLFGYTFLVIKMLNRKIYLSARITNSNYAILGLHAFSAPTLIILNTLPLGGTVHQNCSSGIFLCFPFSPLPNFFALFHSTRISHCLLLIYWTVKHFWLHSSCRHVGSRVHHGRAYRRASDVPWQQRPRWAVCYHACGGQHDAAAQGGMHSALLSPLYLFFIFSSASLLHVILYSYCHYVLFT